MMLFAVALAAVITVLVGLLGPDEETASQQIASVEPASSEAAEREKREFDPGETLEIDDEPAKQIRPEPRSRERDTLPTPPAPSPGQSLQRIRSPPPEGPATTRNAGMG